MAAIDATAAPKFGDALDGCMPGASHATKITFARRLAAGICKKARGGRPARKKEIGRHESRRA